MTENNNSSNKESDIDVSDFLFSKDSCDEWVPIKLWNWMFQSEVANKMCSTKISVLQKPVQELVFLQLRLKTFKNTCEEVHF